MCFHVAQWWRICLPRRRDLGLIPGSGRPPGKGSGNPLQYSCLGNPMGRGAWWATFHGVAKELRHDLATCGSAGKESACNAGDLGLIPGLGRSPGEGKGYPLQYSGLENSMDCIVHGVAKSRTRLSDFHLAPKQQNRACLACKNLKPNYLLSRTQFRKESFQAQKCMLNFPLIFLISSWRTLCEI